MSREKGILHDLSSIFKVAGYSVCDIEHPLLMFIYQHFKGIEITISAEEYMLPVLISLDFLCISHYIRQLIGQVSSRYPSAEARSKVTRVPCSATGSKLTLPWFFLMASLMIGMPKPLPEGFVE